MKLPKKLNADYAIDVIKCLKWLGFQIAHYAIDGNVLRLTVNLAMYECKGNSMKLVKNLLPKKHNEHIEHCLIAHYGNIHYNCESVTNMDINTGLLVRGFNIDIPLYVKRGEK